MGRPRKQVSKVTSFSARLQQYVDVARTGDGALSQAAIAKRLGFAPPQFSKILTSKVPVSAETAAKICGNINTLTAFRLLKAFLNDQAELVLALSGSKKGLGLQPLEKSRIIVNISPKIEPLPATEG